MCLAQVLYRVQVKVEVDLADGAVHALVLGCLHGGKSAVHIGPEGLLQEIRARCGGDGRAPVNRNFHCGNSVIAISRNLGAGVDPVFQPVADARQNRGCDQIGIGIHPRRAMLDPARADIARRDAQCH